MITLFTIIVGILSAWIAFISTTQKLADRRSKGLSRIKSAGWHVILLGAILICATVVQDYIKDKQNQNIQDQRDKYQRAIYDSSLSRMKDQFDSSSQRQIGIVSNVLGIYGFKLDSQSLVLRKLETSMDGKEPPMPTLIITPPHFVRYFMNDTASPVINLKVTSADAASSYFNISVDLIYGDGALLNHGSIEYLSFGQYSLMPYSTRLNRDASHTIDYFLLQRRRFPICYFWIRGEYRRIDGSGIFKVDDLYYFSLIDKKSGVIDDKTRKEILKVTRNQE